VYQTPLKAGQHQCKNGTIESSTGARGKFLVPVTKRYTVELAWKDNSKISNLPIFKQGFTELQPVFLGLLMDTVALGESFTKVLLCYPVSVINQCSILKFNSDTSIIYQVRNSKVSFFLLLRCALS